MSPNAVRKLLLASFTYGLVSLAWALPQDREQLVEFRADTADISQVLHRGIFTGHVELIQGTTHVQAAQALTKANANNQLIMAWAKGDNQEQAHYWTVGEVGKPPIHAYADKIYYYPERHVIELIGNARIEQENNSFRAAKITYDIDKQHVLTQSKATERTTIIFHPQVSKGAKPAFVPTWSNNPLVSSPSTIKGA